MEKGHILPLNEPAMVLFNLKNVSMHEVNLYAKVEIRKLRHCCLKTVSITVRIKRLTCVNAKKCSNTGFPLSVIRS